MVTHQLQVKKVKVLRLRQLRFLGHQIHSDHALCAVYELTHGKTRRGQPRTNYITYIQKIAGHQLSELIELAQNREDWRQLVQTKWNAVDLVR